MATRQTKSSSNVFHQTNNACSIWLSTSQRIDGQTPAPPHNFHRNTCGEMEHGAAAAGDAFSAVRGLMVLRSAAGTVHMVGCPSVLHAGHLSEVNLCRTCVRTPPTPDHLLFVSKGDSSRLAHRDLGCRYLGKSGFDSLRVCRRCWMCWNDNMWRRLEAIQQGDGVGPPWAKSMGAEKKSRGIARVSVKLCQTLSGLGLQVCL